MSKSNEEKEAMKTASTSSTAPERAISPDDRSQDLLSGRFFHSFAKDDPEHRRLLWQGYVIGAVGADRWLVQLFDWVTGTPDVQRLVGLGEMGEWEFYNTAEAMNEAYAHSEHSHGSKEFIGFDGRSLAERLGASVR